MQPFPKINDNQVVLLRAEFKSGHVLDETFNLAVNDSQTVFSIFNSLEEGRNAAEKILAERNDIEFTIYGKDKEVLLYITPNS